MPRIRARHLLRFLASVVALAPLAVTPAQSQLAVIDPANLIQTALNAARALEQITNQVTQITNQVRQLENDARNLSKLGQTFAPEIMGKLREMNALIDEARGIALQVSDTREALDDLFSGDYAGTDFARRAQVAARQVDAARSALQTSLLLQAKITEQLRDDQGSLQRLASASANASGALSVQQATNELLTFQAEQAMRLQALLVAESRADALARAREMEVRAQARAQHEHFFGGAQSAHSGQRPWQ